MPCKFDANRPVVYRAVESACKHLPHERVLVVDSNSDDKSYMDKVKEMGAEVADIGNLNYDTGAYWYAYKTYIDENFFFLIHDSCYFVKPPPSELYDVSVTAFMTFHNTGGVWHYAVGPEIKWAQNQLEKTDVKYMPSDFYMIVGPILFIKRDLLDKLVELKFDKVLPENKVPGVGAMERLWGIALAQVGINEIPYLSPWIENHSQFEYREGNEDGFQCDWFAKSWLFRDHPK